MKFTRRRALLGISVNEHDIRIVEMRGTWPEPQVSKADSCPTPPLTIVNGEIVDIATLAFAVRELIDKMGTRTRRAVMCVPSNYVSTRVIDIPKVPDSERNAVIEGELASFNTANQKAEGLDYVSLAEEENGIRQVLVMAAAQETISTYVSLAEQVGLRLVALEPTLAALFRAASPYVYTRVNGICVAIGEQESEIAVVNNGQVQIYRRVDIGTDALMVRKKAPEAPEPEQASPRRKASLMVYEENEVADLELPVGTDASDVLWQHEPRAPIERNQQALETDADVLPLNEMAAAALALELQRSLDYFRRESPDALPIRTMIVSCDDPDATIMVDWLKRNMDLEIVSVFVPSEGIDDVATFQRVIGATGLRYLTAVGLSMREMAGLPPYIPRFDLLLTHRFDQRQRNLRRRLVLSFAVSVVALFIGFFGYRVSQERIEQMSENLARETDHLHRLEKEKSGRLEQMQQQLTLLSVLKKEGLPVPRVLDAVTDSLPVGLGLREISVNKEGLVAMYGESKTNKQIIDMLEGLRACPMLIGTSLESFDSNRLSPDSAPVVRFQASSHLMGVQTLEQPESSPKPGT